MSNLTAVFIPAVAVLLYRPRFILQCTLILLINTLIAQTIVRAWWPPQKPKFTRTLLAVFLSSICLWAVVIAVVAVAGRFSGIQYGFIIPKYYTVPIGCLLCALVSAGIYRRSLRIANRHGITLSFIHLGLVFAYIVVIYLITGYIP